MTDATTITDLTAERLDLELTEPFAIATATQRSVTNVLVEVTLADGTRGLGEAAPFAAVDVETQETILATVARARDAVVGESAASWRPIAARLAALAPTQPAARCAIETAVLDGLTRQRGMPLVTFFGGNQLELRTDMTVTAGDEAHAVASVRAIVARGIHTIKVKVGALPPAADVARLGAIHAAAPTARLVADANGGYDLDGARAFLAGLHHGGIPLALFEQPVARRNHDALVTLARSSDVLICADESARSAADVVRLAADRVLAINIKPMKCGVCEALAMWHVARSQGMRLMIGGMVESILAMSMSAHLAAGLGGFDFVDLDTPMFIAANPFVGGFAQQGDLLSLAPVLSGHGVTRGERWSSRAGRV